MLSDTPEIRQSPFLFFLRLIVAQFLLTVLVIVFFVAPEIEAAYTATSYDEQIIAYPWLIALAYTLLQALIAGAAFLTWYYPVYRLQNGAVRWRRGPTFAEQKLVDLSADAQVDVRQSWLGRQLDYGAITVTSSAAAPVIMSNLPHPHTLVEQLHEVVAARALAAPALLDAPLAEIIAAGEHQSAEFKASLMWDYRRQSVNKELYEPVMKNLVAFMNANGGVLLIGIDDEGAVLGIEQDMSTLKKPNVDGFENVFNMAFGAMVGMENRQYVEVTFPQLAERTLCRLNVRPAAHPVYLRYQGKEELYVRTGNSSQALPVSKAVQYVAGRFGG
jgi:hypothetical protein